MALAPACKKLRNCKLVPSGKLHPSVPWARSRGSTAPAHDPSHLHGDNLLLLLLLLLQPPPLSHDMSKTERRATVWFEAVEPLGSGAWRPLRHLSPTSWVGKAQETWTHWIPLRIEVLFEDQNAALSLEQRSSLRFPGHGLLKT